MPTLRLFAAARELAGTSRLHVEGDTVRQVVDNGVMVVGPALLSVLEVSRVWVNGDEAELDAAVGPTDEVAIIPPVSGGC